MQFEFTWVSWALAFCCVSGKRDGDDGDVRTAKALLSSVSWYPFWPRLRP